MGSGIGNRLLYANIVRHLNVGLSAVQLEAVGACGSLVIWVVALAVVAKSCTEGLPALKSGDFETVGFSSIGRVQLGQAGHGSKLCRGIESVM